MLTKTYHLEWERYKSRKKCKAKHKLGNSNRIIRVPFWKDIVDMVDESTKQLEHELECMAYLKVIKRID